MIHLGDTVADGQELHRLYPQIPFLAVRGNNDWFSSLPETAETEVDGIRLLCCHGHTIRQSNMISAAKNASCSFVLCGHTHRSLITETDGVTLLNPGSISRPRDAAPSYGIIEIENGIAAACIVRC